MTRPLFTTEPSQGQGLFPFSAEDPAPVSERLYVLKDSRGLDLLMTGPELTSLALQWLALKGANRAQA